MQLIVEFSPPDEQNRPVQFEKEVYFLGVEYLVRVREIIVTEEFNTTLINKLREITGVTPNRVLWKDETQLNVIVIK